MASRWRKGDLGRFLAEGPKRPRFELVGSQEQDGQVSVELWYGGASRTTFVPAATFLKDCINLWELQEVVPPLPTWVKEGASFEFPHGSKSSIRQAELTDPRYGHLTHASTVDLAGQQVTIRRIRRDYTSCLFKDMLVLVPLATIAKYGIQRMTRWARIMSDEDPYEEDDLADLFKGL